MKLRWESFEVNSRYLLFVDNVVLDYYSGLYLNVKLGTLLEQFTVEGSHAVVPLHHRFSLSIQDYNVWNIVAHKFVKITIVEGIHLPLDYSFYVFASCQLKRLNLALFMDV